MHRSGSLQGELLMATPALSGGVMYVRAVNHVFPIGRATGTRLSRLGELSVPVPTARRVCQGRPMTFLYVIEYLFAV